MTKTQAIEIATHYVLSRHDLSAELLQPLQAKEVFVVPARFREPATLNDAWVVWFPYRLPEGVAIMEPEALGIEVDSGTGEARMTESL
jgi:hypothetical protein